jgi:hypothetical protein
MLRKVSDQEALDAQAEISAGDLERLARKLNDCRWILAALFPRGLGFSLDHTELRYSPWSGTLARGEARGDVTLRMPAQAFRDAVEYGHVGDMGTTMFTMVLLNSGIHPRRVYLFFFIMSLHDYGHMATLRGRLKWLRHVLRVQKWRIPAAVQVG